VNDHPKPLNKPLIIFTLLIGFLGESLRKTAHPPDFTPQHALGLGLIIVLVCPVLIIWLQALWNNLIPRVTNWREITFWESAGLMALLMFV